MVLPVFSLATSKSWDLMMPMVWRCQTMFLNKWIKPSDLELPSGNSIGFAWLILESRRLTRWSVFLPSSFGRWLGMAPKVWRTLPPLQMTPRINQWCLRDIQLVISLHASFPVYDKYMIFYIYTVQKRYDAMDYDDSYDDSSAVLVSHGRRHLRRLQVRDALGLFRVTWDCGSPCFGSMSLDVKGTPASFGKRKTMKHMYFIYLKYI